MSATIRDVSDLEKELAERTAALVAALDAELLALRRRRDSLNAAIGNLARKRRRYAAGEAALRAPVDRPPKTDAAETVLREVAPRAMKLRDLHAELLERGWSDDTPRERHALEVAVRLLETSGRAVRPRRGWYAAPPDRQVASEAA